MGQPWKKHWESDTAFSYCDGQLNEGTFIQKQGVTNFQPTPGLVHFLVLGAWGWCHHQRPQPISWVVHAGKNSCFCEKLVLIFQFFSSGPTFALFALAAEPLSNSGERHHWSFGRFSGDTIFLVVITNLVSGCESPCYDDVTIDPPPHHPLCFPLNATSCWIGLSW